MRVFFDSDVIISSLLSSTGAAYILTNDSALKRLISSTSTKEINRFIAENNLDIKNFESLLKNKIKVIENERIYTNYHKYVSDIEDSHVVAGAHLANTKYLLTYNLRHYLIEETKRDLNIVVMTPGNFLQYLRSKN